MVEEQETDNEGMDDLFTMGEAVTYLNTSRMTLEKYYLRGDLPAKRTVGGGYIFRRRDLEAVRPVLEAHKAQFRTDAAIQARREREGW